MTFSVTPSILGEKRKRVLAWGKKLAKYCQDKWPEQEMKMLTNYDGDHMEGHFMFRFESMAAQGEWWEKIAEDRTMEIFAELGNEAKERGDTTPFLASVSNHFYNIVDLD